MYLEKRIKHILVIFLLFFITKNSFTQNTKLDPNKKLTQYIFKAWTTEQGLPSNTLLDVVQDKEGYLWIASYSGLIRFDGINFKTFNRSNIEGLNTNSITCLYVNKKEELLIGTEGSDFLSYQKQKFSSLKKEDNFHYLSTILEDSQGYLWIGTSGKGIYRVKSSTKEKAEYQRMFVNDEVLSAAIINQMVEDQNGRIWIATEAHGIASYKNGKVQHYTTKEGLLDDKVLSLLVDTDNIVWIGTRKGLCKLENNTFFTIKELANYSITDILEDGKDRLWIGTMTGLARFTKSQNTWDFLTDTKDLSYNHITKLLIDREGSLWITTYRGGLTSLQDGIFTNFTKQEGIQSQYINSVCELRKNQYLVGGDNANINLIVGNQVKKFAFKTKLKDRIRNILKDSKGNIWLSTYEGLLKIGQDKQEKLYTEKDGLPSNLVRLTFEDKFGNIWVGTKTGGLLKISPDGRRYIFNKEKGLSSLFIMAIDQDQEGNIWVGTNDAGIDIISPQNQIIKNLNVSSGLTTNLIFNITFDTKGVAWITTNSGLNRYEKGKVKTYTADNGLPNDAVFDFLVDKKGQIWMPSSTGIIYAKLQDLNSFAKGKIQLIEWKVYNQQDGMKQAQCTGATQSLSASNGDLWFPTLGGIVKTSPKKHPIHDIFPPLYIDYVRADGQVFYPSNGEVILPAGVRRIVFYYKAIYLASPEKIEYQYILDSYDNGWNLVTAERKATYTHLRAGEYIFRLKSTNEHKRWNSKSVNIRIKVQAFFYETTWFYILIIFTFFALLISIIQFRVYRIRKNNLKLQQKINLQTQDLQEKNEALNTAKQKVEKSYQNTSILNEIGQKITSYLDFEELGENIYQNVNKVLDASIFGLAIFNERRNSLDYISHIKQGEKLPKAIISLEDEHSPSAKCFITGEELLSNKVSEDFEAFYQIYTKVQSFIYVPLLHQNKKVGIITVQSFRQDAYQVHHIDMLKSLAIFIATALNNAKIYQKITEQKQIIEKKNEDITDSIVYAKRIQDLTLPKISKIQSGFSDSFVFFKPKDIVSGDYYWYAEVSYHKVIAAIDATGHGVPGAFMSLIGKNLLNEIIYIKETLEPDLILNELHRGIRNILQQKDTENNDGMDMAICVIYDPPKIHKKMLGEATMRFAGARNSLVYIQENEIFEMKGDRRSIGGWWDSRSQEDEYFTQYEVPLTYGAMFYMFSDGYQDQFSSFTRKKFSKKRMKSLFLEIHQETGEKQQKILEKVLKDWQGTESQIDDIIVLGFRIEAQIDNL